MNISFFVPHPISVNSYYMLVGRRKVLSSRGRLYKEQVWCACNEQGVSGLGITERLKLTVVIYPPDRRVRDLDNCMKSLQDSLTGAGVWEDDRQVDQLMIYRGEVLKGGKVAVRLSDVEPIILDGHDIALL